MLFDLEKPVPTLLLETELLLILLNAAGVFDLAPTLPLLFEFAKLPFSLTSPDLLNCPIFFMYGFKLVRLGCTGTRLS